MKTEAGNVAWEPTASDDVFQVAFPQYSVQISTQPSVEPDAEVDYIMRIFNQQGTLVEEVTDIDVRKSLEGAFQIMREIHDGARRKAMGVDDALTNILSELDKDDIPF